MPAVTAATHLTVGHPHVDLRSLYARTSPALPGDLAAQGGKSGELSLLDLERLAPRAGAW